MLLLHFVAVTGAYARQGNPETIITTENPVKLSKLLTDIEQQARLHFSFDPKSISGELMITLPSGKLSVKKILEHLDKEYKIAHQEKQNVIILKKSPSRKNLSKTLSGIIQDELTGELLPGVQIILVNKNLGTISNAYGFYSISLSEGSHELIQVQSMGYAPKQFEFDFTRDSTASIVLSLRSVNLAEVTIEASSDNPEKDQGHGSITLSADQVKDITAMGGEPDPLKALQFLPGVISGTDGTSVLSVRGGSYDQNLFLLDEAPVYNPSHALSFFSIFNSDALQSITLHKSEIPVSYGGRLSSIVNVRTKEGNRNAVGFSGAVGTLASRLSIEGPLSKKHKKLSFIASGRYSYAGHVANGVYLIGSFFGDKTANNISEDNVVTFYDINAKINFRKDDRNHFYLSAYQGHDDFKYQYITNGYALSWGNTTATFRWNHIHNTRLFSNTTAVYSNYNYQYRILNNTRYFLWEANFKEFDVKQDYDFYLNPSNHITFGGGLQNYWIRPGTVKPRNESAVARTVRLEQQRPVSTYLYTGNRQTLNSKLTLNYGLRYSLFVVRGPGTRYRYEGGSDSPYDSVTYGKREIEKIYHQLEPRVSLVYTPGKSSFSLSYDRTTQYFHLLANSSVGLPTDVWLPSGGTIRPQQADIFALSFQRLLGEKFNTQVSVFYKRMHNITDFKDNANLFVNRYMESQLLQGRGTAYGSEFLLQKKTGKLTGLISYTLSRTYHYIKGVNNNERYIPRYDKTHSLNTSALLRLSKRWEIGTNYVYGTGGAITMPSGNFWFDGATFNTYTTRNGYRLPDYHRLDLSFRFSPKKNERRKRYRSEWTLDIYNVYARKNPVTIYSQPQDVFFTKTEVNAIYLFKILPSLTYSFKF